LSSTTGTTSAPVVEDSGSTVGDISQTVAERTPVPTPTTGPIGDIVEEIATGSQLAGKSFLGLAAEDWINLGISVLFIVLSYVVVAWLLSGLLKRAARHTKTQFDDRFLAAIGSELKWLLLLLLTRYAFLRLDFWSDGQRTFFDDLFFILGIGILYTIILRLIQFTLDWYRDYLEAEEDKKRLEPLLVMLKRLGYLFVSIITLSIGLSHFGVNVTVLSAAILFAALIIAIGAKAAVTDMISGFIILIDQPFRIGDSIYIKELDTRGDVLDVGTRTTHIRTRDNREVIVPNAQIGESQIVNYNFPDPSYRIQIDIGVAYGIDMERVHQVIEQTVRAVEGVLPEKPVNVYFLRFGESARQIRVRWWIDSIAHEKLMLDRVNTRLEKALNEAGITLPLLTYDLNLRMAEENGDPPQLTPADAVEGKSSNEVAS
jgi:small-conductance mechanosensitive channel